MTVLKVFIFLKFKCFYFVFRLCCLTADIINSRYIIRGVDEVVIKCMLCAMYKCNLNYEQITNVLVAQCELNDRVGLVGYFGRSCRVTALYESLSSANRSVTRIPVTTTFFVFTRLIVFHHYATTGSSHVTRT